MDKFATSVLTLWPRSAESMPHAKGPTSPCPSAVWMPTNVKGPLKQPLHDVEEKCFYPRFTLNSPLNSDILYINNKSSARQLFFCTIFFLLKVFFIRQRFQCKIYYKVLLTQFSYISALFLKELIWQFFLLFTQVYVLMNKCAN